MGGQEKFKAVEIDVRGQTASLIKMFTAARLIGNIVVIRSLKKQVIPDSK